MREQNYYEKGFQNRFVKFQSKFSVCPGRFQAFPNRLQDFPKPDLKFLQVRSEIDLEKFKFD